VYWYAAVLQCFEMPIEDILFLIQKRIEELQQARSILAADTPPRVSRPRHRIRRIEPRKVEIAVTLIPAREQRNKRTPVLNRIKTPTALTSTVPAAPVFVSAAEAKASSRPPQVSKPQQSPGAWLLER
jgi:hypothetical protein